MFRIRERGVVGGLSSRAACIPSRSPPGSRDAKEEGGGPPSSLNRRSQPHATVSIRDRHMFSEDQLQSAGCGGGQSSCRLRRSCACGVAVARHLEIDSRKPAEEVCAFENLDQ